MGRGAGGFPRVPAALPRRGACAVRGCILAVTAIRWSLSELKGLNNHALFAPIVTFLPLLLTGMTWCCSTAL